MKDFHATKVIEYMIMNMKCYDDDIMIEQLFYVFKMMNIYVVYFSLTPNLMMNKICGRS